MIYKKLIDRRNKQISLAQKNFIIRLFNDDYFRKQQSQLPHNAYISKWLSDYKHSSILELGCGSGRYVSMLSALGQNVVGVDPYTFPEWDIIKKNSNAILLDKVYAEALPFEESEFSAICCMGALLYFENPTKALSEMHRVLKPNGQLLIRTLNINNLRTKFTGKKLDPASKNLYNKQDILSLIENAGFVVKKYFSFGFYSPIFPNFYWYLMNTCISDKMTYRLNDMVSEENRLNHIIYAERR